MKNSVNKWNEDEMQVLTMVEDENSILCNIQKVKEALDIVYTNFDFVTEPELVDSYIYEIKSIQLKYQFLLQKAKELGIIVTTF
jgi:hypothetical protein